MPSFFRSDEDVRIFFLKETDTPEKKKQYKRLKTIFDQCVRRPGTKGNFFFHRKCASLGGAGILIMEPQGPVDRGIFQGGITRFGETLSGQFECPATGFLILHVKKNVNEANKKKFGRDIRKLVAKVSGSMSSGGEDRVQIITPKDKELAAKEAAEEKKQQAEDARKRTEEERVRRKLKREELNRKKAEKRAEKVETAPPAPEPREEAPRKADKPRPAPKSRAKKAEAPAPEPEPKITPQQVEERWEAADTSQEGWLESESKAQDQAANAIASSARAEAARESADESHDALQKSTKHLHDLREALKKAGGRAKVDLQQEIVREEAKEKALEAEFQRASAEATALEMEAAAQAEALAVAREEAIARQVEAAQARLAAAKAEAEAADGDEDADGEEAARELADATRQLALAQAEQGIAAALKEIDAALSGIDHETESGEFKSTRVYIGALLWENKGLKKGIERLRESAGLIEAPSDRVRILATHWAHHPDIEWAESAVDLIIES